MPSRPPAGEAASTGVSKLRSTATRWRPAVETQTPTSDAGDQVGEWLVKLNDPAVGSP